MSDGCTDAARRDARLAAEKADGGKPSKAGELKQRIARWHDESRRGWWSASRHVIFTDDLIAALEAAESLARERGEEIAQVKIQAVQDADRLRAAAAKGGVIYSGCETPDVLAEALLVERRKLHEAERQRGANHMLYLGTMENLRKALAEAKRLRATICEATAMLGEETKGRVVYVRGLLRAALSPDAAPAAEPPKHGEEEA